MSASTIEELRQKRDDLLGSLDMTADRIAALPANAPQEERDALETVFAQDNDAVVRLTADIDRRETIAKERSRLQPQGDEEQRANGTKQRVAVGKEPLTYQKNSLRDSGRSRSSATSS
jgi:hypothetical protein